jgi:hypothetical protein
VLDTLETLMDTVLQLASNAVDPDTKSVELNPQIASEGLSIPDVVFFSLMITEHQIPLVQGEAVQTAAEAVQVSIFDLGRTLRRRPSTALQGPALPRRLPQDLLVDEMGDAAEVAIGLRPQRHPFAQPAGDSIEGLVGEVFGRLAAPPLEETNELAADDLVALARALAIRIELREQRLETLPGQAPRLAVLSYHLHSPWREKPAQK